MQQPAATLMLLPPSPCLAHTESTVEGEPIAPVFIEPLRTTKVKDGKSVTLSCQVTANPRPILVWYRQSTPIPECEDFDIVHDDEDISSLTIKEVFPEDSGKYTCVAKNIAGVATTSAELLVEGMYMDIIQLWIRIYHLKHQVHKIK